MKLSLDQRANEETLKALVDGCDGIFGTMQQAIEELGTPRLRMTRPIPSYKGQITLGSPEHYDSAMCIDVERYPRVMIRRPLTASNHVQYLDIPNGHATASSVVSTLPEHIDRSRSTNQHQSSALADLQSSRVYQVVDESTTSGKRDVNREDLAKGYEYGRTAVHISESDLNVTRLETHAGLEIIGFVPWATVCSLAQFACNILTEHSMNDS